MPYRDDPNDVHGGTGDFVTLRRYVSTIEAEADRAALEAAGLEARLLDVGTAAIIPHGGGPLGVRLQVRESDLARATEILDAPEADESERGAHPELRKAAKEDVAWRRQVDADDGAARAFRTALISSFVCPGIGHLYAAWLLASVWPARRALSKSGRWNAAGAVAVLVVVLVAVGAVALDA